MLNHVSKNPAAEVLFWTHCLCSQYYSEHKLKEKFDQCLKHLLFCFNNKKMSTCCSFQTWFYSQIQFCSNKSPEIHSHFFLLVFWTTCGQKRRHSGNKITAIMSEKQVLCCRKTFYLFQKSYFYIVMAI